MFTIQESVTIGRAADEVFAFLANAEPHSSVAARCRGDAERGPSSPTGKRVRRGYQLRRSEGPDISRECV